MPREINGIPAIGLGTWALTGESGLKAITAAVEIGYRHFDTAQSYGTEANVGVAIANSTLDRDAFFITTKITGANLGRLEDSIDDSLGAMGLDHADLTLIHWPAANDTPPVSAYIGDLARAQDAGKTRLIGVSNFTSRHIDAAIAEIGEGRLATNQIERHLDLQNHILSDHCMQYGIAVTAYQPMGGGRLTAAPALDRVAKRHGAKRTQIALAFLLALDTIVIPKSAKPERQKSNFAATNVRLDDQDMAALRALDRGERHIDPAGLAPDWD